MTLPGFSLVWYLAVSYKSHRLIFLLLLLNFLVLFSDVSRLSSSVGKKTIERVLRLPVEQHQILFLVSKDVLEHCSIWGKLDLLIFLLSDKEIF